MDDSPSATSHDGGPGHGSVPTGGSDNRSPRPSQAHSSDLTPGERGSTEAPNTTSSPQTRKSRSESNDTVLVETLGSPNAEPIALDVDFEEMQKKLKNIDGQWHNYPPPAFPTHNEPRTWLINSALTPLAVRLIRVVLEHGDYVMACLEPEEYKDPARSAEFRELLQECESGRPDRKGWNVRLRRRKCVSSAMSHVELAVAEAVDAFGKVDILLCCKSEALIGTVEEVASTPAPHGLIISQFETLYFCQINFIKAVLPVMRRQQTGHIVVLTSIIGYIGTPGMAFTTSAAWALMGYCESLAFEVAPFNIKITSVQPNQEIQSLTNKITITPEMAAYQTSTPTSSMTVRSMLTRVLDSTKETEIHKADRSRVVHRYPRLADRDMNRLVMETVHAIATIGGHENPPVRHVVGFEGTESARHKMQTLAAELEDFASASLSADVDQREPRSQGQGNDDEEDDYGEEDYEYEERHGEEEHGIGLGRSGLW